MKRVALITGGTRGIGRGIAVELARQGIKLAVIYGTDQISAEKLREDIASLGGEVFLIRYDISQLNKIKDIVCQAKDYFGRIDYLINNVGINVYKSIKEVTLEEWKLSQDIILNAPFLFCKSVIPIMREQKFGRIVNIGASGSDYFKGKAGLGPFGVHKSALVVLSRTLALEEIGNGITVNVVAPGSTKDAGDILEGQRIPVSFIPLGRRVEVDEVVKGVLYFLSDKSAGVTGQFLGINGGLST